MNEKSEFKKRDLTLDSMVPEKVQIVISLIFSRPVSTPNGPASIDETIMMICYGKAEDIDMVAFEGEWAKFKGQVINPQSGELDSTVRLVRIPKNVIKYVVIQP